MFPAEHETDNESSSTFSNWSEFDSALIQAQHTFNLKPEEIQKKACGYCKETFKSRNKLFEHLREHQVAD